MAQKRMFDKRVVESDIFTDLPNSSKALYFMAGMSADDKGFFQPRRLQKMCGFSEDDFKILIAKRFFIPFDSGVMVITDWNKNNWLDRRRITETEYTYELNLLKLINEKYELLSKEEIAAKQMLSENRIEENRIEENRIEQQDVASYYEKSFGRTISPLEVEKLNSWLEVMDEEKIKSAIDTAVLNNKKSYNYVNGILNNWKTNGYEREPTWLNKEIEKQELSQEEQEELNELIKKF